MINNIWEEPKKDVKGFKLKELNLWMFAIEFILFLILFSGTINVAKRYHNLVETTDDYIWAQDNIYELERSSDYQTEQVRKLVVDQKIDWINTYFEELNGDRNNKEILAIFKKHYSSLHLGVDEKVNCSEKQMDILVDREIHCMRLIAEYKGFPLSSLPQEVREYELTEEEKCYSPQYLLEKAYRLVFDENNALEREKLKATFADLRDWVSEYSNAECRVSGDNLNRAVNQQRFLMILLFIFMAAMFGMVLFTIVYPLNHMVKGIKEEKVLDLKGPYELRYLASTYNDICRENAANKLELNQQANYDALTGILNRGSFDRLCVFLKGSLQPLAFLLIDVDVFKSINDQYGHEVGDEALKKVAALLRDSFRMEDYPIRYGGDEFAVIMTGVGPDAKEEIGEKINLINRILKNPTEENFPSYSLSVGIAFSQKGYSEDIFQKADQAVYFTKEHGRCGYTFYQKEMIKVDSVV